VSAARVKISCRGGEDYSPDANGADLRSLPDKTTIAVVQTNFAQADCMLYDTVLLRTFAAICDTRSFTDAARLVNLTRSAVSLHVKRLEDQIGLRLFDRGARRLALTEEGEVLLAYARRILALNAEVDSRLGQHRPRGPVRFGAPEYFDPQTLASLLGQFSARYPAVRLQIEMGIGPDIAALFEKGVLDLAIVNRELGEGDGTVLRRERRVWAAARTMQLDPEAPLPLALFSPHCSWRRLALEQLDEAGRSWTLLLQSAGVAGILAALESGFAISVLAQSDLPNSLRPLNEADGLPRLPDFEYVLLRHAKASEAANTLAEVVIDFFRLSAALHDGVEQHRRAARSLTPDTEGRGSGHRR
jgi:DNA-binding transcriptional LysR family regulator